MSLNELDKMILRIKELSDDSLVKVLKATCKELEERTTKMVLHRTGKREKG